MACRAVRPCSCGASDTDTWVAPVLQRGSGCTPQALPVQNTSIPTAGISSITTNNSTDTLTVHQNQPTALVSWQSFNIGQNATVHFDQEGNRTWGVLNRIYQQNPSQILGKMTADGTVYLINQNGILFGSKSQVNTNTLVASTLDVTNNDFQNGAMNFHTDNYNGTPNGTGVLNRGTITTGSGGSVFLVGPSVENSGTISAPGGQIGLVAGTDVSLTPPGVGSTRAGLLVGINQNPGTAQNDAGGQLIAATGLIGMYGYNVIQNGSALASTSVLQRGTIELLASNTIYTGPGSLTASPIDETGQTVDQRANTFQGGAITLGGPSAPSPPPLIEHYGVIQAPSGFVTMNAGQRVYLGPGSLVDVSGLWLNEPVSDDVISMQLNSVQLQDSYQQKGGVLKGQNIKIWAVAALQAMTGNTAIADFSGGLAARQKTASEFATTGGTVTISTTSNTGDILLDNGAKINIAGGGIRYSGGNVDDTMLVSGNKVYDIADAPETLHYNEVLGNLVVQSKKWGVQEKFPGIYYGGANPLPVGNSVAGYTEGANAGSLILDARQVVLNGTINASVVRGVYQTETGNSVLTDQEGDNFPNPLEEPVGGTLTIGNYQGSYSGGTTDYGINAITVTAGAVPSYLGPQYTTSVTTALLSANTLNNAGFGTINLYANTTFTLDQGAAISMAPGSAFNVSAGGIIDKGAIDVPHGTVGMTLTVSTVSSALNQEIYLDSGGSINVSGNKIDNSLAGANIRTLTPVVTGNLAGGQVTLSAVAVLDGAGQGVLMKQGSVIDVGGGWAIDGKGNVTGGNAGSLTVLGTSVVLDGDLKALALPALSTAKIIQGGTLSITAANVEVTATPFSPALPPGFNENSTLDGSLAGKLTLSANRLDNTGFTKVELNSINNITIDAGASISPSTATLTMPVPGAAAGAVSPFYQQSASSYSNSLGNLVGQTSFVAMAGVDVGARVFPSDAATITMGPGSAIHLPPSDSSTPGSITMRAPTITLAGALDAPGGTVTINATTFDPNNPPGGGLSLESGCTITARGYAKPDAQPLVTGFQTGVTPVNGGNVSLVSNADLTIDSGAVVNVSGSDPVHVVTRGTGLDFSTYQAAGNPGAISIAFGSASLTPPNLTLDGQLLGQAKMSGLPGGSLSITNNSSTPLTISQSQVANYINIGNFTRNGFDALTFRSPVQINFQGNMDVNVGRSLTLDSPEIVSQGPQTVQLSAPWVRLIDSNTAYSLSSSSPQAGTGTMIINAASNSTTTTWGFIDVQGAVTFSGFKTVSLSASNDIRLSGGSYGGSTTPVGFLATAGDLTLAADRIYPSYSSPMLLTDPINEMPSNFKINCPGGTFTTLPGDGLSTSLPIYSVANTLTINALSIDNEGFLAAPLGQITLNATAPNGRVYLGPNSTITTSNPAGAPPVEYGTFTADGFWTSMGINQITSAPVGNVTLNGAQVIVRAGATINTSGGGEIVGHQWLPDIQGSVDPITGLLNPQSQSPSLTYTPGQFAAGRYVIVPNNSVTLPDAGLYTGGYNAVYLAGSKGIPTGTYSILPEQYAFLPGAMIVTDLKTSFTPGLTTVTKDGYPVAGGYLTTMGTGVGQQQLEAFSIETAAQVLKQGNFTTSVLQAGAAGNVTLAGNTVILDGNIVAKSLPGSLGGAVSFSGTDITVQTSAQAILPSSFNFSSNLAQFGLSNGTFISNSALKSANEVDLGNSATQTVTLDSGSSLSASIVKIAANNSITFQAGATIDAASGQGNGSVSLITPNGFLDMESGSLVHASDQVTLTIGQMGHMGPQGVFQNGFWGGLQIDHGALNLTAQNVYFAPQSYSQSQSDPSGLILTHSFWSGFQNINAVNLFASGGSSDGSIHGTVGFLGGMSLTAGNSFTINAAAIKGLNAMDNGSVIINASAISLQNRSVVNLQGPVLENTGSFILNAQNISVGQGPLLAGFSTASSNVNSLLIDGFSNVNFNAANDITFQGTGSLVTGAANLNFASARVTTSPYQDTNTPYTVANFTVSATALNSTVNISPPNGGAASPGASVTPGGYLEIDGNSINVSGVIQMASGTIKLNGPNGITLGNPSAGVFAQILDGGNSQQLPAQTTTVYTPGGSVYLFSSASGSVNIGANGVIDVSGVQKDYSTDLNDLGVNAGLISIYSSASANLQGTLKGAAGTRIDGTSGIGGSFILNTEDLSNNSAQDKGFSALNTLLYNGGFTENIDIRLRGVNSPTLTLTSSDYVVARNFNLTTDNWSVDFSGTIDSRPMGGGGTIQFNTGGNLTLEAGSKILSPGATVYLNTADSAPGQTGHLNFLGTIDVGATSGQEGIVHFRGSLTPGLTQANMNLAGTVNGASQILAEGVLFGTGSGVQASPFTFAAGTTITGSGAGTDIGIWQSGIGAFMANPSQGAAIQAGLFTNLNVQNSSGSPTFVPGLEVRSAGALTLGTLWDLTTGGWDSFGPGFLTLRAAGNLNIWANLVDHPSSTPFSPLRSNTPNTLPPSWSFNLVAGADLNSADFMQTASNSAAELYIGKQGSNTSQTLTTALVYTQGGQIDFVSAGTTWIGRLPFNSNGTSYIINSHLAYNLGTYSGNINGRVGNQLDSAYDSAYDIAYSAYINAKNNEPPVLVGELDIEGGAIQSAKGNITITTGGDLILGIGSDGTTNLALGTIRTVGLPPASGPLNYWEYSGGGNIVLDVGGQVSGSSTTHTPAWDYNYSLDGTQWGPSYVWSANPSQEPVQGLATLGGGNLTVSTVDNFLCQAGVFGSGDPNTPNSGGNLTIYSGGNIQGRFLVNSGTGELNAMGNFGVSGQAAADVLEAFHAQYHVTAQGSIGLGAIVNPTIVRSWEASANWDLEYAWDPTQGLLTAATLEAVTGDVQFSGMDAYDNPALVGSAISVVPPYLEIDAGRDIVFNSGIILPPSPAGNLVLHAGRNIYGAQTSIWVSDLDPLAVYGSQPSFNVGDFTPSGGDLPSAHDSQGPVHLGDPNPIIISAGGNIDGLSFYLPKMAQISAVGNIENIYYSGMNIGADDVTTISAGSGILFNTIPSGQSNGVVGLLQGGPGWFVVQAGGSIDLGTSGGIRTIGSESDPVLGSKGSELVVISGYGQPFDTSGQSQSLDQSFTTGGIVSFFSQLQAAGILYSTLQAGGDGAEAQQAVNKARNTFIATLNKGKTGGTGSIEMTNSQICTLGGKDDVYVMAAGAVDVGKTNFLSANNGGAKGSGIFTASGGAINMFTVSNVNVNESRIMTFLGGDITAWSDRGGINAGRGSKSAISASPPHYVNLGGGHIVLVFQPPSVGSGIRTLTYTPGEGLASPPEGNIYLFAPSGTIDAGEAGIAGAKVFLGAEQILNTQNISFSVGSVGVPTSATGPSLGALAGVSNLTTAITPQTLAGVTGQAGTTGNAASGSFAPQWVDVKVIGFYESD